MRIAGMSWYVGKDGQQIWVARDQKVFTVVQPDSQLPTEKLTYLCKLREKASYVHHMVEDENPKDKKRAGRQRGFIVRVVDPEEQQQIRVVPWFKPAVMHLLDSGFISRADAEDAVNLKKKKKQDKALSAFGTNESRVEARARCHHAVYGPGFRVDITEDMVRQRVHLFTKEVIPVSDFHTALCSAIESTGGHVMLARRTQHEALRARGTADDDVCKVALKQDLVQNGENEWLESVMGGCMLLSSSEDEDLVVEDDYSKVPAGNHRDQQRFAAVSISAKNSEQASAKNESPPLPSYSTVHLNVAEKTLHKTRNAHLGELLVCCVCKRGHPLKLYRQEKDPECWREPDPDPFCRLCWIKRYQCEPPAKAIDDYIVHEQAKPKGLQPLPNQKASFQGAVSAPAPIIAKTDGSSGSRRTNASVKGSITSSVWHDLPSGGGSGRMPPSEASDNQPGAADDAWSDHDSEEDVLSDWEAHDDFEVTGSTAALVTLKFKSEEREKPQVLQSKAIDSKSNVLPAASSTTQTLAAIMAEEQARSRDRARQSLDNGKPIASAQEASKLVGTGKGGKGGKGKSKDDGKKRPATTASLAAFIKPSKDGALPEGILQTLAGDHQYETEDCGAKDNEAGKSRDEKARRKAEKIKALVGEQQLDKDPDASSKARSKKEKTHDDHCDFEPNDRQKRKIDRTESKYEARRHDGDSEDESNGIKPSQSDGQEAERVLLSLQVARDKSCKDAHWGEGWDKWVDCHWSSTGDTVGGWTSGGWSGDRWGTDSGRNSCKGGTIGSRGKQGKFTREDSKDDRRNRGEDYEDRVDQGWQGEDTIDGWDEWEGDNWSGMGGSRNNCGWSCAGWSGEGKAISKGSGPTTVGARKGGGKQAERLRLRKEAENARKGEFVKEDEHVKEKKRKG